MSALPAVRPIRREAPRPHIEIAPSREQRRARPKTAYAVAAVAGILAILGVQLLLSMVVSHGAYEISALQAQQRELERDVDALAEQQLVYSSTQYLTTEAAALGMVHNANRTFLDVATGAVAGAPVAAGATGGIVDASGNLVGNVLLPQVAGTGPSAMADATGAGTVAPGAPAAGDPAAGAPSTPGALPTPVTR